MPFLLFFHIFLFFVILEIITVAKSNEENCEEQKWTSI